MSARPASVPDVSLEAASRFVAASGFVIDEISDARLTGHVELGEDHLTPWGVVHGGVYTTIVESAGSVAASGAVAERGQNTISMHNATDFLRPSSGGRASVEAEALQQGRPSSCGRSSSPTTPLPRCSHADSCGCRTCRCRDLIRADQLFPHHHDGTEHAHKRGSGSTIHAVVEPGAERDQQIAAL